MRARPWIPLALAASLAAASVHGEEPRDCLPADLKLRVAFSEPKRLAEALRELEGERKRAGKLAVLKRRFEEAGCAQVEEQAGEGLAEPNLVCRIPGRGADRIAIGSSPVFDGWPAAALLPEIARVVAAEPREHGYAIALLSRGVTTSPAGARVFAHSFGKRLPRAFVHVGMLWDRTPEVGPEATDEQKCVLQSIGRAVAGVTLEAVRGWEQLGTPCRGGAGRGAAPFGRPGTNLGTCEPKPFGRFLDIDPFIRADVPVAGLYALPKDESASSRLDPAAYVASYRVFAAYAVALDQLLDSGRPVAADPSAGPSTR